MPGAGERSQADDRHAGREQGQKAFQSVPPRAKRTQRDGSAPKAHRPETVHPHAGARQGVGTPNSPPVRSNRPLLPSGAGGGPARRPRADPRSRCSVPRCAVPQSVSDPGRGARGDRRARPVGPPTTTRVAVTASRRARCIAGRGPTWRQAAARPRPRPAGHRRPRSGSRQVLRPAPRTGPSARPAHRSAGSARRAGTAAGRSRLRPGAARSGPRTVPRRPVPPRSG